MLDALKGKQPFQVPEGYFEALPEVIRVRIAAEEASTERLEASLEDEAPILHSLKKKEIFEVPEGYFPQMAKRVEAGRQPHDAAEASEAPVLSAIQKQRIFRVPSGYFEAFPSRLNRLLEAEGKRRFLWDRAPGAWLTSAAAAVLLLVLGWWLLPEAKQPGLEQLPTQDLLAMAEAESLDTYALASLLGPEGLENIDLSDPTNGLIDDELEQLLDDIELSEEELQELMTPDDLSDILEEDLSTND